MSKQAYAEMCAEWKAEGPPPSVSATETSAVAGKETAD